MRVLPPVEEKYVASSATNEQAFERHFERGFAHHASVGWRLSGV
jgi:hypothetical protein